MAIQVWPNFLSFIGTFGIINSVVYFESSKKAESIKILFNSLFISLFQSAFLIPVGMIVLTVVYPNANLEFIHSFKTILIIIPISIASQYLIGMLQAHHLAKEVNVIRLIIPIGYSISLVFLYFIKLTIFYIISVQVFLNIFVLCISLLFVWKHFKNKIFNHFFFLSFDFELIKSLHKYGVKVWVGDLSQNLNGRSDQIFVATVLTPVQMGYYAVSLSVANISLSLVNAFKSYLLPELASINNSKEKTSQIFAKYFNSFWNINFFASLLLAMAAIPGIHLLYGTNYHEAILPASILILGGIFSNAKSIIITSLQGIGKPLFGSLVELMGFVLIGLSVSTIGKILGAKGVTLSLALIGCFQFMILMIFSSKNLLLLR